MDMTIHVWAVSCNSPRDRVWKGRDGLWHVMYGGRWLGAFGKWERAIEAATTGRIVLY